MPKEGNKKLKVLICGLGSIGTRHARILLKNFLCEVVVLRTVCKGNALGLREISSWSEAESFLPDVVFVTNPTRLHVTTALKAARLGASIFLEKPVGDSIKGVAGLQALCVKKKLVCYVAYPLRFLPVVQKAKDLLKGKKVLHARAVSSSYLPDWRPGSDIRNSYSARQKEGGGVILDLSHEYDLMSYLLGPVKSIEGIKGRASSVTIDAEDFADSLMKFKNGVAANVHLNFMSRKLERFFHIDFQGGYLRADLVGNTLVFFDQGKEKIFKLPCNRDDYLWAQTKYFLDNLNNPKLMNNLKEAKDLFAQIIPFRKK